MKTEFEIAEEMLEKIKKTELPEMTQANISGLIISHKVTCQRWLEFLEYFIENMELKVSVMKPIQVQITDLKNTIKLYEDNGI